MLKDMPLSGQLWTDLLLYSTLGEQERELAQSLSALRSAILLLHITHTIQGHFSFDACMSA